LLNRQLDRLTAEKMIDSHTALVGTPEEVIEQVEFQPTSDRRA
jgi:hypothetical protein